LEFIVGGNVCRKQELATGQDFFLIGRHAKMCHVVLDAEPKASRVHAVLQCKAETGELFIYDTGSSHGTLLNNRRIEPCAYEPVAVGHQLRFCAEGSSQCLVVICGPDELMEEEKEVDLSTYREEAARQREKERAEMEQDLRRRKMAKKERLAKEKYREVVAQAYAEKAKKKQQQLQEELSKDLAKVHEVTWGMSEDAVEVRDELGEEAEKLMDSEATWIDPEKVRNYKTLTDKQEQMLTKFQQKKRKLEGLSKEKARLEGGLKRNAQADHDDDDTEFDPGEKFRPQRGCVQALRNVQKFLGGANPERYAQVEEKIMQVTEEAHAESDRLLVSLGLKTAEMSEKAKKARAQVYDTNVMADEDDDFFDRTKAPKRRSAAGPAGGSAKGPGGIDNEFGDLPRVEGVETRETLTAKVKLLEAERAQVEAKIGIAKLAEAKLGANKEDSLDAFMMGNERSLMEERLARYSRRRAAVAERLEEATKMLAVALRNADGEPPVSHASVASAKKKEAAPAEKKAGQTPASEAKVSSKPAPQPSASLTATQTAPNSSTRDDEPKDADAAAGKPAEAVVEQAAAAPAPAATEARAAPEAAPAAGPGSAAAPEAASATASSEPSPVSTSMPPPASTSMPPPASTAMPPPRLPPKKVYGAALAGQIKPEQGGIQHLAPAAPAKKRKLGPTMPPPGSGDSTGSAVVAPGAGHTAEEAPSPPKKKVYGVAARPVSRDSEEHFE